MAGKQGDATEASEAPSILASVAAAAAAAAGSDAPVTLITAASSDREGPGHGVRPTVLDSTAAEAFSSAAVGAASGAFTPPRARPDTSLMGPLSGSTARGGVSPGDAQSRAGAIVGTALEAGHGGDEEGHSVMPGLHLPLRGGPTTALSGSDGAGDGGVLEDGEESASLDEQQLLARIHDLQRQLQVAQEAAGATGAAGGGKDDIDGESIAGRDTGSVLRPTQRLIVVSNRLPVTFAKDEESGEWTFTAASGGLVSALQGARDDLEFIWIGWLGREVGEEDRDLVKKRLRSRYSCVPVFLDPGVAEDYYNGFSNGILWPVFHYVPMPTTSEAGASRFDRKLWEAYQTANRSFAEVIISEVSCALPRPVARRAVALSDTRFFATLQYTKGDLIWIQDYHLTVLPSLLRARLPRAPIGWFLHTPFPSSEVYRVLPVRDALLESLLCADLLGFHTYDYVRHFLSSCARVLGARTSPSGVEFKMRYTTLGVYPIGIDPSRFEATVARPNTQRRIKELRAQFHGVRVLLGVDRMDYIKGIPHKLLAMEALLRDHADWRGRVVLVQIGVPTRTTVDQYKSLHRQVNELVGRINGRFGTLVHSPIHYVNNSIDSEELCALYCVADALVVSSIRDGMNLVCQEFVACQGCVDFKPPGALILSEFAGSAQSLSGAIRVNPWNTTQVAAAINSALNMTPQELELRHHELHRYVTTTNTATMWAQSFVRALSAAAASSRPSAAKVPNLAAAYRKATRRLLVINVDGLLAAAAHVVPAPVPERKMRLVARALADDPRNTVVLVSTRDRRQLLQWFGTTRAGLAADSASLYRPPSRAPEGLPVPAARVSGRPGVATKAGAPAAVSKGLQGALSSASAAAVPPPKAKDPPISPKGSSTDGPSQQGTSQRASGDDSPEKWVAIAEGAVGGEPATDLLSPATIGLLDLLDRTIPARTGDAGAAAAWAQPAVDSSAQLAPSRSVMMHSVAPSVRHGGAYGHSFGLSPARIARLMRDTRNGWKAVVRPIFTHFTDITPGAFFEERANSSECLHC